ncbi:MAG: hypothetical protein ACOYK6_03240 [Chthoniobacterales bacterium]
MSVCIFRILTFLALTTLVLAEPSPSPKDSPTAEKAKVGSSKIEPGKNSSAPIDLPAPVGEDMKGIIIPQYDAEGRLVMNFLAEKARKINENDVEIDSLTIGFFEKDGKDITVLVPHGVFHLDTKILSTDSQVTIKREDFEMVGESATFDTTQRFGTMKGHVHTEVRNGIPAEEQ